MGEFTDAKHRGTDVRDNVVLERKGTGRRLGGLTRSWSTPFERHGDLAAWEAKRRGTGCEHPFEALRGTVPGCVSCSACGELHVDADEVLASATRELEDKHLESLACLERADAAAER